MVKTYYKTTWYSQKQIRYFRMRIDYSHSSMKWAVYSTFSLIPVQLISGHPRWFSALPCIASSFNVRRSYRIQCFRVVPFLHIIRLFVWDNAFVTHGSIYWWWRSSYGVSLIADTVAAELPWYFSFSSMKWMECRSRFVKLQMSFLSSYRSIGKKFSLFWRSMQDL